jgi:Type I phosphodiesterase / nucleotide pyrophosphatase
VVGRPEFRGSGLSAAAYRGAEIVDSTDVPTLAAHMLAGMVRRPSIVFGYLPDVDSKGHAFGNDSPQWMDAAADLDRLLTLLIDGLTPDSALVVTADHGQLDIPPDHRFDLDADSRLREGVRVVTGEPRVRYLHTIPGATEDVIATWRGVLGDTAWVVPREEAVAEGWFGPVPEEHLLRIGDVVAACRADHAVLASLIEPPQVGRMVGFHGSWTAAEMMIPLLIVRR